MAHSHHGILNFLPKLRVPFMSLDDTHHQGNELVALGAMLALRLTRVKRFQLYRALNLLMHLFRSASRTRAIFMQGQPS